MTRIRRPVSSGVPPIWLAIFVLLAGGLSSPVRIAAAALVRGGGVVSAGFRPWSLLQPWSSAHGWLLPPSKFSPDSDSGSRPVGSAGDRRLRRCRLSARESAAGSRAPPATYEGEHAREGEGLAEDEILGDYVVADAVAGLEGEEEEDEDVFGVEESSTDGIAPPPFLRRGRWLEEATATLLDASATGGYPLGELLEEDFECFGGVMAAWSRRHPGSLRAALSVERLLKRVADEVREGNPSARVTTRLYTYAIEAWARSGARGAAHRAQQIHDNLVLVSRSTGDKSLSPTVHSYNSLLNAWSKSAEDNVPIFAEKVFAEMLGSPATEIRPDAVTFTTLIDIHSRSRVGGGIRRCEELFEMMDELRVRRNVFAYSALQTAYARRCRDHDCADGPRRALDLLDRMLDRHDNHGDTLVKPNVVNFNACLRALSRCRPTAESAQTADDLLRRMESSPEEGGYDVEPNRMSYALSILAAARCPDVALAAKLAERILVRMEERAKMQERRREEVSSAAPPSVALELECFNVVLTAISRTRRADSFPRCLAIVNRMEQYADRGKDDLRPSIRSWNAVVNAIARSPGMNDPTVAALADKVVEDVFSLPNVRPNAFTFAAVLSAYQRDSQPDAERSDALVRQMEEMYEIGELDSPPDVYHMTILCGTWAKSQHPRAADRCLELLSYMEEKSRAGDPGIKPNVRTYNAVLACLCRSEDEDRAEQILCHMLRRFKDGDKDCKPDNFSFNTVIHTSCRSKKRDSGKRAEMILDRFLEFHEDHPDVAPDTRSLFQILTHYSRSREIDAPYRAEYILHRMIELRRSGMEQVEPTTAAFATVIDTYACARHPDAGRNGERLVALMKKLAKECPTLKLPVKTVVMNSLLSAWASSGDEEAGHRAEQHLDEMERLCENGDAAMCPDTRSYLSVLSAWSKSTSFDKAERALGVFRRMERQVELGNDRVAVEEHAYSLVINACAFSNGSEEIESDAFRIAVIVFDELLNAKHTRPDPLTFGWFLQACGRLRVPPSQKASHLKRAFVRCCKDGLVSDFVLTRLRGAATDDLLESLLGRKVKKAGVCVSDLPPSWSRNIHRRSS